MIAYANLLLFAIMQRGGLSFSNPAHPLHPLQQMLRRRMREGRGGSETTGSHFRYDSADWPEVVIAILVTVICAAIVLSVFNALRIVLLGGREDTPKSD